MYLCIYEHNFVSSFKYCLIIIFYQSIYISPTNPSSIYHLYDIYLPIIYLSINFKPVLRCQRLVVYVLCALPWYSHSVDHYSGELLNWVDRFNNIV